MQSFSVILAICMDSVPHQNRTLDWREKRIFFLGKISIEGMILSTFSNNPLESVVAPR